MSIKVLLGFFKSRKEKGSLVDTLGGDYDPPQGRRVTRDEMELKK